MANERSRLVDDSSRIVDPRKREWFRRARDRGWSRDSWVEIVPGTREYALWASYFDVVGWRPVTFPRGVDKRGVVLVSAAGTRSWTAPCRLPSELGF